MGGLIPLACYQVLTGLLTPLAVLWAVPEILGIGLIMFTNNTCDIEKDAVAHRRTLSVLLNREKARRLYHVIMWLWLIAIILIVGIFFTQGLIMLPFYCFRPIRSSKLCEIILWRRKADKRPCRRFAR